MMKVGDRTRCRRKPERTINERHTFVKPWPEPPGDTCNELINLIYRRLTEIQSQMRGTLIVRPLATDTIVYTRGPYSLTIALQLVSPRSLGCVHDSLGLQRLESLSPTIFDFSIGRPSSQAGEKSSLRAVSGGQTISDRETFHQRENNVRQDARCN